MSGKYRIAWRYMTSGYVGHGYPILSEEEARKWKEVLDKKDKGEIEYWIEEVPAAPERDQP